MIVTIPGSASFSRRPFGLRRMGHDERGSGAGRPSLDFAIAGYDRLTGARTGARAIPGDS